MVPSITLTGQETKGKNAVWLAKRIESTPGHTSPPLSQKEADNLERLVRILDTIGVEYEIKIQYPETGKKWFPFCVTVNWILAGGVRVSAGGKASLFIFLHPSKQATLDNPNLAEYLAEQLKILLQSLNSKIIPKLRGE